MTADVLLDDGTIAVVRALEEADRRAVEELHDGVSDSSFRFRFFSSGRAVGRQYVDHLFSGHGAEVALVALVRDHLVAVATAERLDDPRASAEVAFLVGDTHRGHGIGILLLEHLAAAGRDRGLQRFVAEVLADNVAMLGLFRAAGFRVERTTSRGVSDVVMSTTASARAVVAADVRESRSEARSLAAIIAPRRVAVVGASVSGEGIGSAVLTSILEGGFTGQVVVVHPTAVVVQGVPAHARLVDVPGHVDLVVVVVPAGRVPAVMADAVAAGVSTVVVVSSGFEETGPFGADLQHRLVLLARRHSTRLVGPNCLGVLVNDPAVRLNATFASRVPTPGGLAVASQSGGVGITLLDAAVRSGLGVHSFVSLGNKADVSGNDLLAVWTDEPAVTAAALYLESLGNAPKFARLARRFASHKPLLVVLGGTSLGGRRAGVSHTGAPPAASGTAAIVVEALAEHSGVIPCHGAEELAETALVLAEQPLPKGHRVAVISNAGGMGVLVADAADRLGLEVPELSPELRQRLLDASPALAGPGNPIDLGAGATAGTMSATVAGLLGSGEVDALVVVLVATRVGQPGPLVRALANARRVATDVPVLLVSIGAGEALAPVPDVTVLPSVAAAVGALARTSRYAGWLAARGAEQEVDVERAATARSRTTGDDGWLEADLARALVSPYVLVPWRPLTWPAGHDRVAVRLAPDPALGPTITLSPALGEVALLLLPVDEGAALRTVATSLGRPVGSPDVTSVTGVVMGLASLAADAPRVVEVDAVIASASGLLDVRVRLGRPVPSEAASPRRMRVPR